MIFVDICDEFVDDICVIFELKFKNVEFDILMGMMFKYSDFEVWFSFNMNVLIDGVMLKVCLMKEVLCVFFDYWCEVLGWCFKYWMEKIDYWLEVFEGFIIVFFNLDCVIDIICYDDKFKEVLMVEIWGGVFV